MGQLLLQEAVGIVAGRSLNRPGLRSQRLHQHSGTGVAPSGPAGQLRDQRESALLGPEVGEAERLVGVQDHAQGDVREVMSLGHHLRTHQHAGRRRAEPGQRASHPRR